MEAVTEFLKKLASKGIKLSAEAGRLNCYAQKGVLTNDLRDGITKFRTEIMALLEARKERLSANINGSPPGRSMDFPLRPVDRAQYDRLPLSFAQERLWLVNQLEPDSIAYNLPFGVTIRGELDITHLDQALNLIIARHENLRTAVPQPGRSAQQLILDSIDFKLERIDLSHYESREERDKEAKQLCQTDAVALFDLARGPLLRGKVIKLAEQEHILMLYMHHIVSDGWSAGVLIKELGSIMEAFRQGRPSGVGPAADSVRGLQRVATHLAGRGRSTEAATCLLAGETGGCSGEFGPGDRLPPAERAKLCRSQLRLRPGCAADRAAQKPRPTRERHAVHDPAGCLQGIAVSLHRDKAISV